MGTVVGCRLGSRAACRSLRLAPHGSGPQGGESVRSGIYSLKRGIIRQRRVFLGGQSKFPRVHKSDLAGRLYPQGYKGLPDFIYGAGRQNRVPRAELIRTESR